MDSLTLEQIANVVTGRNVTGDMGTFPGLAISDGQQGVLMHYFVSGWGQPAAATMTWDKKAMYDQGKAIGVEYKIRGVHVCDGPTSSPLGRTAWGGRQAEAYAFDSYLNGIAMSLSTKGEVDSGVIASGKVQRPSQDNLHLSGLNTNSHVAQHFLLYEQETNRQAPAGDSSGFRSYNVRIGDKALHETYLAPWYDAVRDGMGAAMCAMNLVNGSYSCENEPLIMGLLKEELGFPGFIVPDIGSQKTVDGSANGGLDWASDQMWSVPIIVDLVNSGKVSRERIVDMAIRNIIPWYQVGADSGFPSKASQGDYRPLPKEHKQLIREVGAKSLVLLKNTNNALPLKSPKTLSIFGSHAGPNVYGPNEAFNIRAPATEIYPGHLATASGAGSAPLPYLVTPYQAIMEKVAEDGTQFRYLLNNTLTGASTGFVSGGASTGVNPSIRNYASFTEVCLVFINAWGGEGGDRKELRNQVADGLVKNVADNCNNTIVVLNTVGPRIVDSWIEHPNVTALLYGAPLGQESGHSIVDVLYGDVNPSGALTYTIAKTEDDYPAKPCTSIDCPFDEGNYIDYKHFDRASIEPRFPFGHGLSYTTFVYSDLSINTNRCLRAGKAKGARGVGGRSDLWKEPVTVSLNVANTGGVDGAHVVQLYLTFPGVADQPIRQLRGFEKINLASGASGRVEIMLRRRDLSYWNVVEQEWVVAAGEYTVNVGASSRDFRLTGKFEVN